MRVCYTQTHRALESLYVDKESDQIIALLEFSLEVQNVCVISTKMSCTVLSVKYVNCRQYGITRVPNSLEMTK